MEYLVRLVQVHESFRISELESLAVLANVNVEILFYSEYVCLLIIVDLRVPCIFLAFSSY